MYIVHSLVLLYSIGSVQHAALCAVCYGVMTLNALHWQLILIHIICVENCPLNTELFLLTANLSCETLRSHAAGYTVVMQYGRSIRMLCLFDRF